MKIRMLGLVFCLMLFVSGYSATVRESIQSGNLLAQDIDPTTGTTNNEKSESRKIKLNESYSVEIKTTPADFSSVQNYELSIFKAKKRIHVERLDNVNAVLVHPITLKGKTDNIIISSHTGGSRCCFDNIILSLGGKVRKIAEISDQHSSLEAKDIDEDGTDELILNDWTFVVWHTSFQEFPHPKVVLKYQNGNYKPSAKLMRKPYSEKNRLELWKKAREISALLKELLKDSDFSIEKWLSDDVDYYSQLLPPELWAIMLDLLYTGNGNLALEFLEKAWYKKLEGEVVFLKSFQQQLLKSPYISVIKEMNPTFFK